jgi:predicted  nucleic acid-binding Zn-ribbon protein
MKTEVQHLKDDTTTLNEKLVVIDRRQTGMETKQAFLEGVVSTQLDNIQKSVTKIEKRVDDWEVMKNAK